jgi:hypothetical protein
MSDRILILLSLLMSTITLTSLVVVALLFLRRMKSGVSASELQLAQISEDQRALSRQIRPLVAMSRPLDAVFTRLHFAESFDADRFATVSRDSALAQLNRAVNSGAADGLSLVINSVQLLPSGAEMTFTASRRGQVMLANGSAVLARHGETGRLLPHLKDADTGKFIEIMKGTKKLMSRLGAMSAAVVGAAHIVAGADISKRLKQLNSKVDLLLAYRRIDQLAKLERIYTAAGELGSGSMTREKCWELWRRRGELRELRCSWRRELQHHLTLIDDPKEAPFFKRLFTRSKTNDKGIHDQITECELQLGLMEYSMRLDQALAVGSGTVYEFEHSLAGELHEFGMLAELLEQKADLISNKYPELTVKPTVTFMVELTKQYKSLLEGPAASESPAAPEGNATLMKVTATK